MSRRTWILICSCTAALAAPAAAADAPSRGTAPARTLDAVSIEGEVDVPRVLFISSRDHLRFHDDTGRSYRPGPLQVILAAALPTRLRFTAHEGPALSAAAAEANPPADDPRTGRTPAPAEESSR